MLSGAKIVFEDKRILVCDKPSGLVVNRSETIKENTLQDELSKYFKLGSDLGIGDRAGIVHRLDRETSGLIVVAKTKSAFENLQAQFKERVVEKTYLALVHGNVKETFGSIEANIARVGKFGKFGVVEGRPSFSRVSGGREARTDFELVNRYILGSDPLTVYSDKPNRGSTLSKPRLKYLNSHATQYSYLKVFPKTGRTHQIRVHLKSRGNPVVSDLIYGPSKLIKFDLLWCPRLFLHASRLSFFHPKTKKRVEFKSDLPKDLKDAMLNLRKS